MKRTTWPMVGLLSLAAGMAAAQDFSLDWYSIDSGGGTSTGGVYRVSGTIGQPDAGVMSGGAFTLVGGFWGVVSVVQTPSAPQLRVLQNTMGNALTIAWPLPAAGYRLEQTFDLSQAPVSWMPVPFPYQTNATDIFITVPMPAGTRFYRLSNP